MYDRTYFLVYYYYRIYILTITPLLLHCYPESEPIALTPITCSFRALTYHLLLLAAQVPTHVRTSRETTVWRTHLVDLQQRAHTRAHAPISTWSPRIAYSIKYAIRLSQSHQRKPNQSQFNTSIDQTNIPSG